MLRSSYRIFNPPWMSGQRRRLPHSFPPPWVRKCQNKRLNSLDRWPTVVLLLSMLCITMATANLSVDNHGSQLATISSIAAKDDHPWESPHLGEISRCYPWRWHRYKSIHLPFFGTCSTAFDTCKTTLIYSNAKENDFLHILINAERLLIQLFLAVP